MAATTDIEKDKEVQEVQEEVEVDIGGKQC